MLKLMISQLLLVVAVTSHANSGTQECILRLKTVVLASNLAIEKEPSRVIQEIKTRQNNATDCGMTAFYVAKKMQNIMSPYKIYYFGTEVLKRGVQYIEWNFDDSLFFGSKGKLTKGAVSYLESNYSMGEIESIILMNDDLRMDSVGRLFKNFSVDDLYENQLR